jgi:hypothetical protein
MNVCKIEMICFIYIHFGLGDDAVHKKLCKINCPCAHDIVQVKEDTTILDLVVLIFHHNYPTMQSSEPRKITQESMIVLGFWVGSTRSKFIPSTCGPSTGVYHRQNSVQILSPSSPIILVRSRFPVPNICLPCCMGYKSLIYCPNQGHKHN